MKVVCDELKTEFNAVTGKLSCAGEVLEITFTDVVFAVTLLVCNQVIRLLLMYKVFNPVLQSFMS